ncbi:DUF305 domain-containing protein [Kocuria aegyptia]|uniref:DUF305 domain-containing protein n=1 Tax=Kocuria aegyptia TaxID=330943 RepID=A0ABP4X3N2_9MICC
MNRSTTLPALALALALTGCGAGSSEQDTGAGPGTAPATSAPGATTTGAAADGAVSAEHNDADVLFAQMMLPHHEQAVRMSEMLLAEEGVRAEVADFAQRVIDAQGPEIEHLNAMLAAWGAEPSAGDVHGTEHGSDAGMGGMGGMMTAEDMQALETAQGQDAARLYLEQMTVHHEGAVEMARDQAERGQNPQAVELARHVAADQEAEIAEMERMLRELPDGT